MNAKKAILLVTAALVLFFLISQPTQAAGLVSQILTMLKDGALALVTFVKNLF